MALPQQDIKFLTTRADSTAPHSLSKGHIALILVLCTPFLITLVFAACCYYQRYARKRAEQQRIDEILAERARVATQQARQWARWEAERTWHIEGERIRTLAILEGLVPEVVETNRSRG